MSETVLSLILLAVYFIVYVVKHIMKEHPDVKGTPVGNDTLPESDGSWFDVYEENPNDKAVVNNHVQKTAAPKRVVENKVQKAASDNSVIVPADDRTPKVSLKNRFEAKRAFIHAEIFNRKY